MMIMERLTFAFPEISLILAMIHLGILNFFNIDSEKVYAKVSRFWIIVYLLLTIIFYNKSINEIYFENNAYTLLFKMLISIFIYVMFSLSGAWFLSENQTGCRYYILILSALLTMELMLSSINLLSLMLCYAILIFLNYRLLSISNEKYPSQLPSKYVGLSGLVVLLMVAGFQYFNFKINGNLEYKTINQILSQNQDNIYYFLSSVSIIIPFLYALGIVPFHFMAEEKGGKSILPVSHYFMLILPFAIWGTFVKINFMITKPYAEALTPVYTIFAILSVVFGAMGANARINLYRIYAYGSMFHFGIILLILSYFDQASSFSAFIYFLMYMISLNSLYLIFYNLKSYGEYLSSITALSGISQTKPYTTAALLVSLFSLIGLPPLAGFLGQLNLGNELIKNGSYISLGFIILCLLALTKSYLEIIKTAYFEQKIKVYDSENKIVLINTLLSVIIILTISFNPYHIIQKLQDLYYVLFI